MRDNYVLVYNGMNSNTKGAIWYIIGNGRNKTIYEKFDELINKLDEPQ